MRLRTGWSDPVVITETRTGVLCVRGTAASPTLGLIRDHSVDSHGKADDGHERGRPREQALVYSISLYLPNQLAREKKDGTFQLIAITMR